MGVTHHPSSGRRDSYAVGDIAPGASLAVAIHLAYCERCARDVGHPGRHLRAAGGALIVEPSPRRPADASTGASDPGLPADLHPMLRHVPLGPWRWLRPGVRVAELRGVSGLAERSLLVGLLPNVRLAFPASAELMVLLAGRLEYAGGRLRPGDLLEIAEAVADGVRACGHDEALSLLVGDDDLFRPSARRHRLPVA